jgi:purine-nucleoside phosphorylase
VYASSEVKQSGCCYPKYMSLHLEAKQGQIADIVLITGDPLRARHFAKHLQDAYCYNHVRGMEGYTGFYQGKKISIQGTGIGIPSTALYLHELICDYHIKTVIRVGTAGALQPDLKLGQIVLANKAMTDSAVVQHYHQATDNYPQASQDLLQQARASAEESGMTIQEGLIFSTDLFYAENPDRYQPMVSKGVLAVEMETSMVYAMAQYFSVRALSLLTISDHVFSGEALAAEERELKTTEMLKLALKITTQTDSSSV